ncbi:SdrD B-like domain-containing protein [Listeria booriae]|uniref:SdrD B-like domain-containing protein n=1 Tax=Listeria booriae TaxID=1552123 RepID=UPI00162A2F94|nr:SdrD B-like domain-containing protein [Listeria booriae]MBC2162028.1 hypothetical protein [Listeria booriae]MBC2172935.1 hypothetical protein [Listeria booriae]
MKKHKAMKRWGTGILTGVLVLGSLTPVVQPYKPVSAAENTLKQLQASGQGSVSDVMFEDLNGNGKQDAGESKGIAGIKVELHNDQGTLVGTSTTGADGRYSFTDLPDGTYYLHVDMSTLPTDERLYTTEGINGSDGNSTYFTITDGNAVTGYHFGFYPNEAPKLGSVSDVMFEDLNGNTTQDSGEKGVAGIKVELFNTQGSLVATTTTGADGRYTFADVPDGTYYVHVDLSTIPTNEKLYTTQGINGADGNSSYFTISNGNAITGFHFGFYPQQGAIQSYVYNDANKNGQKDGGEAGISGVHVALYTEAGAKVADATTDSAGAYHFDAIEPGRYYAKADIPDGYKYQSGAEFGADGTTGYFTVASEQTLRNELNLGLSTSNSSAVSGKVTDAATGAGLANTRVELRDVQGNLIDSQQTDTNGNYNFTALAAGNYYTKVVIPTDYSFASGNGYGNDGNSNYIQLDGSNSSTSYSIALRKQVTDSSAISGKVTDAATGSGLANTRVELHDVQGNLIDSQQTDTNGNYNFTGLAAGNYYTKVVIPSNYDFASSNGYGSDGNSNYIQLNGENTSSDYSIALRKQANTTISGVINTPSGQGVSENVSLYSVDGTLVKTVSTDSQGNFSFAGVSAGNYYVKASIPEGYTFQSSQGFGSDGNSFYLQADGTSNISNLRLTLAQKSGQIRSTVFNDLNKNGTQEVGESGVAGATVTLYSNTGAVVETTTTDANGLYKFETVTPGTYYVKVTPPTGYENLANAAFGDDGVSGYIAVEAEQTRTDMNASVVATVNPNEVSDMKWINNKDGSKPSVGDGGTITIANDYLDSYNNKNVNVQFFNKEDQVVSTKGWTVTLSDPSLLTPITGNPVLLAFTHTEKTGSTLVTVKDADGKVVRTFTIVVTGPATVLATDIDLNTTNINTTVGATGKVDATVQPTNATNKNLTYTPADTSIISVDANGNWTAKKAGTTTIAVKTTDGSNITKTITVKVSESVVVKEENIPNYPADVITEGKNIYIDTNFTNTYNSHDMNFREYDTAGNLLNSSDYVYTSSDNSVLAPKLDQGDNWNRLAVVGAGTATITVKDKAGNTIRTFIVHVAQAATTVPVTDISLDASNITAKVGDTGKINATVAPTNATNKNLTYTPADTSIISVDANGNWTAKKAGTTTVQVKTTDGSNITKTVSVTVTDPTVLATDISLAASSITAEVNDTGKVDATVQPTNATNKVLTYTPADASIITVDANGNWVAKKSGKTTITVRTTDGSNISKTVDVTVNKSMADRMKSADLEFVLGRNAPSSTKAYVYPHSADVPAGVTYRVESDTNPASTIQVGTSNGVYHQEIESSLSYGAWGEAVNGPNVRLIATYQGVDYLVTEGSSTNYLKANYTKHVFTD